MAETKISCKICSKEVREGTLLHSLSNDPKLSTIPMKTELSTDENLLECNECKLKLDEERQAFMQNETILKTELKTENLPQLFLTNVSQLVSEENGFTTIKDEFVEVEVKNENTVKDEYMLFNMDMPSDMPISINASPDISYYCQLCNYATGDKEKLSSHVFTHLLKCNMCSFSAFDHSSIEEHKKVHFNILYYRNRIQTALSRHNEIEKPYKCKFCSFCSSHSSLLKTHLFNKHSGAKPFTCDKCDYRCCKKTTLVLHNRKHTQEKPFKCIFCSYCSYRKDILKRHIYKHSRQTPFSCDKCDYRCYSKRDLSQHSKIHTREKSFECNFCDFCSSRASLLKTRMFKYSGEKPFSHSCDKCDYRCC